MTPKCRVSGLTKRFGDRRVVDDVSLDIADGEFIVILGPSGCGKTTTLRMVAGLAKPDGGTIAIDGRTVSAPEQGIFVRPEDRNVGMVFQSYAIWPHMSVFENVAYPLRVRRTGAEELQRRVHSVLELVGLASEAKRSATELSGGQMQRVALARALVFGPALLLFDEPLSNLDLKLRERLRTELKALQRSSGVTSIYVTHDQTEAVELADRIVVMESGRAVQIATPVELYQGPRTRFVAEFISSANIFEATVDAAAGPSRVRVRADDGRCLVATHETPVSPGDRVDVVIHPEDCLLMNGDGTQVDAQPVQVLQRRFQGTSTRYTVRWASATFDVVALGTVVQLAENAEAKLYVAPERARIIARRERRQ
jgi:iron(III) transport system ATP-binding protein